ncbi:ribonuclease H-like domain-containing protein [Ustulina deusta]|nr:ribonuclease H-like domain-containing protein [Ustulina deusta]
MPHSLGLHRILYRTLYANHRLRPALSGPAPSCSVGVPCILHQNGNTAVTVTTARQRHFSTGPKSAHRYRWASRAVSDDVYDRLESHILDSTRRASQRFPVMPPRPDSDAWTGIPDTLNSHHTEYRTPPSRPDPDPDDPRPRKTYAALAIDCEMVRMRGGEEGLVSIAVVDFFTGDVVLRSLVQPPGPVTDWRTDVTRVDKAKLNKASRKGKVLSGWLKVRKKIFDMATCQTIFIGHALANDLRVLRIATDRVVDSMAMMSRAVFGDMEKIPRNWSLRTACRELLDVDVQEKGRPHNPLEDALATRELVLRSVVNPEKLAEWAAQARAIQMRIAQKEHEKLERKQARQKARLERRKLKEAEKKNKSPEQRVQEAAERARVMEERRCAKVAERAARIIQQRRRKAAHQKAKRQLPTASV